MSTLACTFIYMILLFHNVALAAHFGATSVFLAWIGMTLLLGRFPALGVYIYM